MDFLENITEKVHQGYFVDLFVRVSNAAAIHMYKKVGNSNVALNSTMTSQTQRKECQEALIMSCRETKKACLLRDQRFS